VIESFAAFLFFFLYYNNYCGIPPGALVFSFDNYTEGFMNKTQDELTTCQNTGSSIFFVTLVLIQFGNMLASRTQIRSFFEHNPFFGNGRNLTLFLAMAVSLLFAIAIVEFQFMNDLFHTNAIPVEYWFMPLGFAVFLFLVDELRKLIVRKYFMDINEEEGFELKEEVGLSQNINNVLILNQIPPNITFSTQYLVQPFIGTFDRKSISDWKIQQSEIKRVLEIPIDLLLNGLIHNYTVYKEDKDTSYIHGIPGPVFQLPKEITSDERIIWGFSARTLLYIFNNIEIESN